MLVALRDALMTVKKSVGKSVGKILELLSEFPEITRESLAAEVGLSVRGVEKNLAQLKSAGRSRRARLGRKLYGRLNAKSRGCVRGENRPRSGIILFEGMKIKMQ